MADSTTTNLALTKPEVGGSTDTWGTKINADLDLVDALFGTGPALLLTKGGTGAQTAAAARTNLGLGTIATQNAASVSVTDLTVGGTAGITGLVTVGAGGIKFSDLTTQTTAAVSPSSNLPYTDRSTSFTAPVNSRNKIANINVAVTLPAAPTDGQWVTIQGGQPGCSVLRNGKTIGGLAEDMTVDLTRYAFTLVYVATASGWSLI